MVETDTLLVKCPNCGAWPMAANLPKSIPREVEVEFRCSLRTYHEVGRFLRGRTLKGDEPHRVA